VVTIHNIGAAAAGGFDVGVEAKVGDEWKQLAAQSVDGLPAIQNFEPVQREVIISTKGGQAPSPIRVMLDSGAALEETCELNNTVIVGTD
jgi:hypothetical protein